MFTLREKQEQCSKHLDTRLSCRGFVFSLKYFPFYSQVEKVISSFPLGLRKVPSKFFQVAPGTEAASSLSLKLVLSGQHDATGSSPFAVMRAAASPALPHLEKPLDQNQQ